MERKLINVAIANSFYEEKKNLLDTYYPFVLKAFDTKETCTLKDISETIKTVFDIDLPVNSLKNILTRYSLVFQTNKSGKSDWSISLSSDGKKELNKLIADEKIVERRIEQFYTSFIDFSTKRFNKEYSIDQIKAQINKFILDNLLRISLDRVTENDPKCEKESFEMHFIYFLAFINLKNNELVDTFEKLWKGSIIWNELKKEAFEEPDIKFRKTLDIYIDTNFALSLLNLHNPIINQAAKELFDLIQGIPNINLYILDVTLREIYALLDLYDLIKDNYSDIEIDSVFYYLKQKGYTTIKSERLKDNLENDLLRLKIKRIDTSVLRENDQRIYANIYDFLLEKKSALNEKRPEKGKKLGSSVEKSAHHDTSVIVHVLRYKDRFTRSFESSKAIFLTSSFTLYKNFGKISRNFESFPCVVLDTTLTNILYLKNPQKTSRISLSQIIKTHCNYLIVDQSIWNTYLSIISQLEKEKEITTDDYARLVTKNQFTQEYLLTTNTESINKTSVKGLLGKIKEREKEKDKSLSEKEMLIQELSEANKKLSDTLDIEKQKRQQRDETITEKDKSEKVLQDQINDLKREGDLKDYIERRLEEEFEPLSARFLGFLGLLVISIFFFFLSDYIISDEFAQKISISDFWVYLFRSVLLFALIFISGLISKIFNKNFWSYIMNRSKLKNRLKDKFLKEYKIEK